MMRSRRLAASLLVLSSALAGPMSVAGSDPTTVVSPDALAYAESTGVSEAEAARRIALQPQIAALAEYLHTTRPTVFAGLFIQHEPYVVIVQATDVEAIAPDVASGAAGLDAQVDVREVAFSFERLKADQLALAKKLEGTGMAVDLRVRLNRVIVEVPAGSSTSLVELAPLPESAVVDADADPRLPALQLRGGLALSQCTSGWTVYYGSNTNNRGITTAGHCDDAQSYKTYSLTYQNDEHASGNYDVQSHKRNGATYKPEFQSDEGVFEP